MELFECMNFLLSVSQNKVFKRFSEDLKKYGLTPAQYGVLNCLWKYETLSPKQISEKLYLEPSTVSGILDKMQHAGFIERSVDENNRRNILVFCTSKSYSLQTEIEKTVENLNNQLTEKISASELKIVKQVLEQMIRN